MELAGFPLLMVLFHEDFIIEMGFTQQEYEDSIGKWWLVDDYMGL